MRGAASVPADYSTINLSNSVRSPSTVHCKNTHMVEYYARYLFQKVVSIFEWEGIPSTWSMEYFLYNLYAFGFVTVFRTDRFGIIPQWCALKGFNVFYRPTGCIVSNPLISRTVELTIGKNCELITLTPDFRGLLDKVSVYADMMALCMESAAVSLVNSKNAYVFKAKDKATAESLKKMYDEINAGNPAVTIDKTLADENEGMGWEIFNNQVGQNYITSNLLEDLRMIENQFCTEIGIPNANYNKKERMNTLEVTTNRAETFAVPSLWLDCLERSLAKVNAMFGLNISVSFRFDKEVNEVGNNVDSGSMAMG